MPRSIQTKILGATMKKNKKNETHSSSSQVITPTKEQDAPSFDTAEVDDEDHSSAGSDQPFDVKRSLSQDASSTGGGSAAGKHSSTNNPEQTTMVRSADAREITPFSSPRDDSEVSMLSGRRTVKPLAAPSTNGLHPPEYEYDTDDDTREAMEEPEDMPMDERQEFRRQQREALLCGIVSNDTDDVTGGNFCDMTLNAIGNMCGTSPTNPAAASSPERLDLAARSSQPIAHARRVIQATLPQMKPPYGVEEQTAIEVEYVEPERRQDAKSDVSAGSTKKKNSLVQAVARKAKQDFERSVGKQPVTEKATTSPPPSEAPPDNVYSSFSAAEKQRFLKLINGGITPSDATLQVLKERKQIQTPDVADSSEQETPTSVATSRTNNNNNNTKRGLAFWKKPKAEELTTPSKDLNATEKQLEQPSSPVTTSKSQPRPQQPVARPPVSPKKPTSPKQSREITRPRPHYREEEDDGQFARSGINYYDAVRKVTADDEADMTTPDADREVATANATDDSRKKKSKRLSKLGKFGFARLRAGNDDDDDDNDGEPEERFLPPEKSQPKTPPRSGASRAISDPPTAQAPPPMLSNPPPQLPPMDLPPTPPRPVNTARSAAEELAQDDELVHGSRAIFKPIPGTSTPTTPSHAPRQLQDDDKWVEPGAIPVAQSHPPIEPSLSDDSLLQDNDQEDEIMVAVTPTKPASDDKPTAPPPPESTNNDLREEDDEDGDAMEQEMTNRLLGSLPSPPTPPRRRKTDMVELDVDTAYMNSTELMSQLGGSTAMGDQRSVVSGKSYKTTGTYGTAGTNYTQSTRSRRPGAAKQRLTSQKTGETSTTAVKIKGWQESIKAVAAEIDRVWDPVKGWIDYNGGSTMDDLDARMEQAPIEIHAHPERDDEDNEDESEVADGSLPVEQNISEIAPTAAPSVARDRAVEARQLQEEKAPKTIPEPPMPTRSVQQTIPEPHVVSHASTQATTSPEPRVVAHSLNNQSPEHQMASRSVKSTPSRAAASKKGSTSPVKSRGWVESMKEATARIDTRGKRWDPEKGWIGLGQDELHLGGDRYGGNVADQADSDMQDFGTIPRQSVSQDTLAPLPTPGQIARDPSGQLPYTNVRKDPDGKTLLSDDDHNSVDASTKSGTAGRYVQLGDSGSVSSYYFGKPSNKAPEKESPQNSTVLSSTPETLGKMKEAEKEMKDPGKNGSSTNRNTLLVNVRKEKVNSADASMFPELSKNSRRGSGPVDLDEIDDLENGSFGAAPDFSWDEDPANAADASNGLGRQNQQHTKNSTTQGKGNGRGIQSNPAPSVKSSDSRARSEVSYGSVSTSSKSIPLLRAPKRDTSPIRGRKAYPQPSLQQEPLPTERDRRAEPSGVQGLSSPSKSPIMTPKQQEGQTGQNVSNLPGSEQGMKTPSKSPRPANDTTKSTYTGESSPSTSSVKDLHQYWERRSHGEAVEPPNSEWSAALAAKVSHRNPMTHGPGQRREDDRDSLFDFNDSEGAFPTARRNRALDSHNNQDALRSLEEISDLSPIRTVHDDEDDDDDEETPSEVSTSVAQGTTFLQRLQACAAPIMPKTTAGDGNFSSMPMAHPAFMRSNPAATGGTPEKSFASRFVPPALCGKPDVIVEEDEDDDLALDEEKPAESRPSQKPSRSRSNPRSGRASSDVSSVISDEQFGQKTAYLEAIAMKAAVSGSKKSRRSRSSGSETSGSSSKHSESWQRFLDKKKASSTGSGSEKEDVAKAAEKYAVEKVEEMMEAMAARSRGDGFNARPMEEATGAFPSVGDARPGERRKNESSRAAEDLAAARVDAMIRALSNQALDEGEAEI